MVSEIAHVDECIREILEKVKQQEDEERVIEIHEQTVQLVVFLLGEKYYAFHGDHIKEIVPVTDITYVPGMPDYLLGVINVRGEIESVLDLRTVLSLPADAVTKRSRIAIGQVGEIRSGVLVDSVEDVLEMPEDSIHKPESVIDAVQAEYIAGEGMYNDHDLLLLDLGTIFAHVLHD